MGTVQILSNAVLKLNNNVKHLLGQKFLENTNFRGLKKVLSQKYVTERSQASKFIIYNECGYMGRIIFHKFNRYFVASVMQILKLHVCFCFFSKINGTMRI